jgi:hypothetical protein
MKFYKLQQQVLKLGAFGSAPRPTTNLRILISSRSLVEQVMFDYILPLPSIATSSATKEKEVDEVSWTDRLLITMRHLSEKSIVVLIGLSCLKSVYVYVLFFRKGY